MNYKKIEYCLTGKLFNFDYLCILILNIKLNNQSK